MSQLLRRFLRASEGTVNVEYVGVAALVMLILIAVMRGIFDEARLRALASEDSYSIHIPSVDLGP